MIGNLGITGDNFIHHTSKVSVIGAESETRTHGVGFPRRLPRPSDCGASTLT